MNDIALYVGWIVIIAIALLVIYHIPLIIRHVWRSGVFTSRVVAALPDGVTRNARFYRDVVRYWFMLSVGWEGRPDYSVNLESGKSAYWPGYEHIEKRDYDEVEG